MDTITIYFIGFAIVIITAVICFCMGFILPVLSKSLFNKNSPFIRFALFLKNKAGYIASFGLGIFLTIVSSGTFNPYYVSRWLGFYEHTEIGNYMLSHEDRFLKGEVPQELIDWYVERNESKEDL